MKYHRNDSKPWMYEMLVKCIESRPKPDTGAAGRADRDVRQTIGFAAYLAKKNKNVNDLRRVADMMILRNYYGTVGDPGYQTNIGELVDLACKTQPADGFAPLMSLKLAVHDKDPRRMADAADRLLSLGWPGYDDQVRRDVKADVNTLAESLKAEGKTQEADSLTTQLAESETRDVYIRLTWKGEADVDMSVAEPLGATAKYHNPRTVFGGAIVKNGYGSHPEEVYTCPRGFDGVYSVVVEKIVDYEEAKPVTEATLEVILHEGTDKEERTIKTINLAKPEPVVVKLTGGRRKEVLPFFAPPPTPNAAAVPGRPKEPAKGATRKANPPAAPRGAPIR